MFLYFFFFSSRRRHTRFSRDWSSDVCSSDLSILGRARAAGFTTLVVTLDTWLLGWRPHDLDQSYLPFIRGTGLAVYFSDPAFRAGLAKPPEEDLQSAVLRWL